MFALVVVVAIVVGLAERVTAQTKPDDSPPPEVLVITLQEQVFKLEAQLAEMAKENAQLRLALLDDAKRKATPELLKKWGAKPGEVIDWQTMTKVPDPTKTKPAETKQP